MPSMYMSSTTHAGPAGRSWQRKSPGDENVRTPSPAARIRRETLRRTPESSSTTSTVRTESPGVEVEALPIIVYSLPWNGDVHRQAGAGVAAGPEPAVVGL